MTSNFWMQFACAFAIPMMGAAYGVISGLLTLARGLATARAEDWGFGP